VFKASNIFLHDHIHYTAKKIISVRILFTLFVLMSIYLNLLCPTYIDIFYPDGKYVSVTVEKGTT